jgi:hypothetical protein
VEKAMDHGNEDNSAANSSINSSEKPRRAASVQSAKRKLGKVKEPPLRIRLTKKAAGIRDEEDEEHLFDIPTSSTTKKIPRKRLKFDKDVVSGEGKVARKKKTGKIDNRKPMLKLILNKKDPSFLLTQTMADDHFAMIPQKREPALVRLRMGTVFGANEYDNKVLPEIEISQANSEKKSSLPLARNARHGSLNSSPLKTRQKGLQRSSLNESPGSTSAQLQKSRVSPRKINSSPVGKVVNKIKLDLVDAPEVPLVKPLKASPKSPSSTSKKRQPAKKMVLTSTSATTEVETTSRISINNTEIINADSCAACKASGYFICCETCPNSFHLACVYPPLQKVPSGVWLCLECMASNWNWGNRSTTSAYFGSPHVRPFY